VKHPHYFKPVAGLQHIDVYRVLQLFGVTDPCLQHSIKKLLVAGGRGAKDISQDVQEAIDTLLRWQEMRREDRNVESIGKLDARLDARKLFLGAHAQPSFPHLKPPAGEEPMKWSATIRPYGKFCDGCGYNAGFHADDCIRVAREAEIAAEAAAGIDDDSPRQQAIQQNGNDGAIYNEPGYASGQIPSTQDKEPERPRHLCQTCAQGHSLHQCTAGIGGER